MRYPKAPRTDLTAPTGKFRVLAIVVEAESADLYTVGDFSSVAAAEQALPGKERASGALFTLMTTRQS